MGLRFRKSITLCKGVRLNFGRSGMSVTTGTKGFHNTYNLGTGRRTSSIGIPGTGISYVTTSGGRTNQARTRNRTQRAASNYDRYDVLEQQEQSYSEPQREEDAEETTVPDDAFLQRDLIEPAAILSSDKIKTIHYSSDEKIDWTEMLIQDTPPKDCNNKEFWEYCHSKAYEVLNGNIDVYFQLIQDVGPLDDLLDYGFGFQCGTDDPNVMAVEFEAKQDAIMPSKSSMAISDYNELLQDYICSCSIRVARDMFALLPVSHVIVNALSEQSLILSVDFERRIFTKLKFKGSDASDLVVQFKCNMAFDSQSGFQPVKQLEG